MSHTFGPVGPVGPTMEAPGAPEYDTKREREVMRGKMGWNTQSETKHNSEMKDKWKTSTSEPVEQQSHEKKSEF